MLGQNGIVETIPNGGQIIYPTLRLEQYLLQELANELDKKGFKPKEGFLDGKLQATEKHLEDMRTIVFKKTK